MPIGRNALRPYIHTRSSHKIMSVYRSLCKNGTLAQSNYTIRYLPASLFLCVYIIPAWVILLITPLRHPLSSQMYPPQIGNQNEFFNRCVRVRMQVD
jgi:hypothetical protein